MNKHYWSFCMQCERDMIVCGSCKNNTCNGGEGCIECPKAYEFEKNSEPDKPLGLWIDALHDMENNPKGKELWTILHSVSDFISAGYDTDKILLKMEEGTYNQHVMDEIAEYLLQHLC